MTSATARSNALEKQKIADDRKRLYAQWRKILDTGSATREDYLKVGGYEKELTAFFWQYVG